MEESLQLGTAGAAGHWFHHPEYFLLVISAWQI